MAYDERAVPARVLPALIRNASAPVNPLNSSVSAHGAGLIPGRV